MNTLNISEKTYNDFKDEQIRKRKETGRHWSADRLISYLLDMSRKVKK